MKKISTDEAAIAAILSRGVEGVYPSKDFLAAALRSGKQLTLYAGFDPTGPTLHIGHTISLMKLRQFQELGHQVIFLIGDFTAMIGDPTDKTAARKKLTAKEVAQNLKAYKKQAEKIISFSGSNKAQVKYNAKWLGKLKFADVLELASLVTVQQMLERDMFKRRQAEEKPIFVHEFLYPLMQGYDTVAMDVDGEVGGNDQTFNMLMGRTLMKQLRQKEKFVITSELLTDEGGKKMGKTEGNMLALSDAPSDMFGKVMSWTDGMVLNAYELCTAVSMEEITAIGSGLASGAMHPKAVKERLAREIVSLYYGLAAAEKAATAWEQAFSAGGIPDEVQTIESVAGTALVDVLIASGIIASRGEFRRLVEEGAVTNMETDTKAVFDSQVAAGTYRIGKKRFIRIKIA